MSEDLCGKKQNKKSTSELHRLSVADMKDFLKDKNVKGLNKMNRPELCEEMKRFKETKVKTPEQVIIEKPKKTKKTQDEVIPKKPKQNKKTQDEVISKKSEDKPKTKTPKLESSALVHTSKGCLFNPLHKTKIYHIIANQKQSYKFDHDPKKEITYETILIKSNLSDVLFEKVFKTCDSDFNILIFNNTQQIDAIKNITECLEKVKELKINFKNVTIINQLPSNMYNLFGIYKCDFLRKCINVLDGTSFQKFDIQKYSKIYKTVVLDIKKENNRFLDNAWWVNYYFSRPLCADNRFEQYIGTCWFNATFNALILIPDIANLMRMKWEILPKDEKKKIINLGNLDTCLTQNTSLRIMLYMIIYNILVKGKFVNRNRDKDFLNEVAGYTKSLYLTLSEDDFKNYKISDLRKAEKKHYSESGNSLQAITTILMSLFTVNVDYAIMPQNMIKKTILMPRFYVIHRIENNIAPEFFKVEETKYTLQSAAFWFRTNDNGAHAIAGLRCKNEWYIYDSNNVLIKCDWHKGNFKPYEKIIEKEKERLYEILSTPTFYYAIYTRQ